MERRSLDSERPIMAPSLTSKRTSKRYSTFSASPSFATVDMLHESGANSRPLNVTAASGMQEIKEFTQGLDRLGNKKLELQRFVPTEKKTEEIKALSVGAKLDRALGHRMSNQDATFSKKGSRLSILGTKHMTTVSEKQGM